MKKILVIHPYDESTRELEAVYAGLPADVLHRPDLSWDDVDAALGNNNYDRVILLGHGTSWGLMNMRDGGLIFTLETYRRYIAPRKVEIIAAWCHANEFFEKFDSPPEVFCTGMFVSEPREAEWYFLKADAETIAKGFALFSKTLAEAALLPIGEISEYVKEHYVGEDEVTRYNREEMLLD